MVSTQHLLYILSLIPIALALPPAIPQPRHCSPRIEGTDLRWVAQTGQKRALERKDLRAEVLVGGVNLDVHTLHRREHLVKRSASNGTIVNLGETLK
jgi:hypothetical protein